MSDRAALLSAIRADPDDDTARLVYADWLDENGEAKRAAYIRTKIQEYRDLRADTALGAAVGYFARRAHYFDRVNWSAIDAELGAAMKARLAAERLRCKLTPKTEGAPRVEGVHYQAHRGFYGCLWVIDTDSFLANADAIFRAAPITRLELDDLDEEQARELVKSGHLAQIRELELPGAEPGAVRVLGTAKDAAGVRELEIHLGGDGADFAEALGVGKHWTGLEQLEVFDVEDDATESALDKVFERPQFRGLRRLSAWNAKLDDKAARAIAKHLPELRRAELSLNDFTSEGALALARSKTLRHLRHLDLSSCNMENGTTPAAAELINTPNLPELTVLMLDRNFFRSLDTAALKKAGRGPGLRVLELGDMHLKDGLGALAQCPALSGLWYLDLENASIEDAHIGLMVQQGRFDQLACLQLGSNDIGSAGAKALAAWPSASRLQWLGLSKNPIGEAGAKALADSPHLKGLKRIDATGRGTATLKKRFKKAFGQNP